MASRIEASDDGLRAVLEFRGVRGALLPVSGHAGEVRAVRLGGMTTGLVCIASDASLSGKSRPATSGRMVVSTLDCTGMFVTELLAFENQPLCFLIHEASRITQRSFEVSLLSALDKG